MNIVISIFATTLVFVVSAFLYAIQKILVLHYKREEALEMKILAMSDIKSLDAYTVSTEAINTEPEEAKQEDEVVSLEEIPEKKRKEVLKQYLDKSLNG